MRRTRAYPRSRGGTLSTGTREFRRRGLSPLARGNLCWASPGPRPPGPIPARAGEPGRPTRAAPRYGAYPRSRGGTGMVMLGSRTSKGLSPLARGNLLDVFLLGKWRGPIPARAGEPTEDTDGYYATAAYPRSRGGTRRVSFQRGSHGGLSPLARGNPHHELASYLPFGPIPARAGEPVFPSRSFLVLGAYPRSRGGTKVVLTDGGAVQGLSPLARGNRWARWESGERGGPIPARAGEP